MNELMKLGPVDAGALSSFLTQIKYGDAAARTQAVKHATYLGTGAIPSLGSIYASGDPGAARAACEALKRICYNAGRPGATVEANTAATHLVTLTSKEYPRHVRADAMLLLGLVGTATTAALLSTFLTDMDVREDARMAIERIPGSEVDDVLRKAARVVPADYRSAIDQSLRHRRMRPSELGTRR